MKMAEAKLGEMKLPGRVLPFTGPIGWLDRILSKARSLAAGREGPRPAALRLVGRLSLGGAKTLFVVEFETRRYLVASGADSVGYIQPIPAAAPVSAFDPSSGEDCVFGSNA